MVAGRPIIGLLHPGRMGAAIGAQAVRVRSTVCWCPQGRSEETARRAEAAGLTRVDSLSELVATADVIMTVCPPSAAEDVAGDVAARAFDGIYVNANAISPARFTAISRRLADSGATVVDGDLRCPADRRDLSHALPGRRGACRENRRGCVRPERRPYRHDDPAAAPRPRP